MPPTAAFFLPPTLLAAQSQPQTLDELIDLVAQIKSQQKILEARLAVALEQLTAAHDAGDLDASFCHNDWSFTLCQGRLSTVYSDHAKAAIKAIQDTDIAMGRATQQRGAGFWTVKPPAI